MFSVMTNMHLTFNMNRAFNMNEIISYTDALYECGTVWGLNKMRIFIPGGNRIFVPQ